MPCVFRGHKSLGIWLGSLGLARAHHRHYNLENYTLADRLVDGSSTSLPKPAKESPRVAGRRRSRAGVLAVEEMGAAISRCFRWAEAAGQNYPYTALVERRPRHVAVLFEDPFRRPPPRPVLHLTQSKCVVKRGVLEGSRRRRGISPSYHHLNPAYWLEGDAESALQRALEASRANLVWRAIRPAKGRFILRRLEPTPDTVGAPPCRSAAGRGREILGARIARASLDALLAGERQLQRIDYLPRVAALQPFVTMARAI